MVPIQRDPRDLPKFASLLHDGSHRSQSVNLGANERDVMETIVMGANGSTGSSEAIRWATPQCPQNQKMAMPMAVPASADPAKAVLAATPARRNTQVFIVASPRFVADALSRALALAGWRTGAALASPAGLVQHVNVIGHDVIVVVDSETVHVETVLPALRQLFPNTRLLALSNQWTSNDTRSEVVPLNCGVMDVLSALQRLAGGGIDPHRHALTGRHLEILQLITRGMTAEEAGAELGIAPKTVNNHLSAVYRRLGARNLTQAVLLAARAGLIDVGSFT